MAKNARSNVVSEKFYCPCGGEIKMLIAIKNNKKRLVARCTKCGTEKRKPSDFR
jgi:transcription elongation factor Elf1